MLPFHYKFYLRNSQRAMSRPIPTYLPVYLSVQIYSKTIAKCVLCLYTCTHTHLPTCLCIYLYTNKSYHMSLCFSHVKNGHCNAIITSSFTLTLTLTLTQMLDKNITCQTYYYSEHHCKKSCQTLVQFHWGDLVPSPKCHKAIVHTH